MNYSFVIRKACPEDAEAIWSIIQESSRKYIKDTGLPGTLEALSESVENVKKSIEKNQVFVAFIDNNPAGTVRVEIFPDKTAYISRFGVRFKYHNIGIGKALMNLVDKLLISNGINRVYLHTASKHKDLVRFYYERGFYVDSVTKDRGYARALMVKEL